VITSSSNLHIKSIRRLRERKYRLETGLSYIEGLRIVYEAVLQNEQISEIIYSPDLNRSEIVEDILTKAKSLGFRITEVSKSVFEYLSSKDGPQGLAAVIKQNWFQLDSIDPSSGVWVALFEVADPGNLGTILRSCDAVGAAGVILIDNGADPYDPSTLRASMGGIFSTKVVRCSSGNFVDWVKQKDISVIGTSDKANHDFRNIIYSDNMVLLMGSERHGIPIQLLEVCRTVVSIPMKGNCDSLNLAVATSLILYEVERNHL
jgi:TrmH family RNA methyltransferase